MAKIGAPAKLVFISAGGDGLLPRWLYIKKGERVSAMIAVSAASEQVSIRLKMYELK